MIDGGRVVAEGTAAELKARVGSETVELRYGDGEALAGAAHLLEGSIADRERLTLRVPGDGTAGRRAPPARRARRPRAASRSGSTSTAPRSTRCS